MQQKLRKLLAAVALAPALALPVVVALEKISESDTFWHLKTGEWIWAHGKIPRADFFSSTVSGKPWLDWEWLFQAALYAVYALGGFEAVVALKAAIVGLTGWVIFATCRRGGVPATMSAAMVMATVVAARHRLEARPDVVAFLFAATFVAVLERARVGRTNALWWLPPLQALWTNVQASFPLGVALCGAYAVAEKRCRMKFVVALLLVAAACMLNPYGWRLLLHALQQTQTAGPAGAIGEWQPTRQLLLTEPDWALRVFWVLFWLCPAMVAARWWIQRREFPWAHALVVAGMSLLALRAHRFTGLYAVVTAPVLAGALTAVCTALVNALARRRKPATAAVVAGRIAVAAAGIFLVWAVVTNRWAMAESRPAKFGLGVEETIVPVRALAVMEKLPLGLELFNTFPSGGPLIWKGYPQWRVFCDGRANLYGREFIRRYQRALFDPEQWEQWMRERSVSVAYIQYGTADDRTLLEHLARSPAWELLYFDHAACIFVHQSCRPRLHAHRPLQSLEPVPVSDAEAVRRYARALAEQTAGANRYARARVMATVGNFLLAIGARQPARLLFEDSLAEHPRTSEAWMNLAVIESEAGHFERALELTERLLAINPQFFYARLLQAQIRATQGELIEAVNIVQAVLKRQPRSAQAWLLRAQLAARQGDRPAAIRALQRMLALPVEDPHLYWFLGQLLAAEGRTNEAVSAYEQSLRLWRGPATQRQQLESELAALRAAGR